MEDVGKGSIRKFCQHLRTKNGKVPVIPLCSALVSTWRNYTEVHTGSSSGFLFCNKFVGFLKENALRFAIVKYNTSRGVERTSIHAFRRTFARKDLVDCGGDAFTLCKDSPQAVRQFLSCQTEYLFVYFPSFDLLSFNFIYEIVFFLTF